MKKVISLLLVIVLACGLFAGVTVSAAKSPTISISNKTAVAGDLIAISLFIKDNPGIMAMTFALCYDKSVLEYKRYYKGYPTDYTVSDHKGRVNFVNCESGDLKTNDRIITFLFSVKKDAKNGTYPITIANINRPLGSSLAGCFAAQSSSTKITPKVNSGSIKIGTACKDGKHKYSASKYEVEPACVEEGLSYKTCRACGHTNTKMLSARGHDFEDFWTVDREALSGLPGIMSRHCKNCDARTDIRSFEYNPENNLVEGDRVSQNWLDFLNGLLNNSSPQESPQIDTPSSEQNAKIFNGDGTINMIALRAFLSRILTGIIEAIKFLKTNIPFLILIVIVILIFV